MDKLGLTVCVGVIEEVCVDIAFISVACNVFYIHNFFFFLMILVI